MEYKLSVLGRHIVAAFTNMYLKTDDACTVSKEFTESDASV
jgi:hypothetical protein